jgi:hypothetical protein
LEKKNNNKTTTNNNNHPGCNSPMDWNSSKSNDTLSELTTMINEAASAKAARNQRAQTSNKSEAPKHNDACPQMNFVSLSLTKHGWPKEAPKTPTHNLPKSLPPDAENWVQVKTESKNPLPLAATQQWIPEFLLQSEIGNSPDGHNHMVHENV